MSPKSATIISLALLFLTLASLTLSTAAEHNGCPSDSIPGILKHYELPGGIFPGNVKSFSCESDENNPAALRLTIELEDNCTVTRELPGFKNVVVCKPEISATITPGELSRVDGVRVKLTGPFGPFFQTTTLDLTVTDVRAFNLLPGIKIIQIYSADGIASPPFPTFLFPSNPPTCDPSSAAALDYSGSARVAKNNQDAPMWVYKYGRLLPVVVAA